jgi:hypothetical protein
VIVTMIPSLKKRDDGNTLFLTTTHWERECSQALPTSLEHLVGATGSENETLSRATLTDQHAHPG